MLRYDAFLDPSKTPQTERLPDRPEQVQNNAGGYVFALDPMKHLERFLILGTEGGTYYASERKHTLQVTDTLKALVETRGVEVVAKAVSISLAGRAPKNDPALFVHAYCAAKGSDAVRQAAFDTLPKIARIGTHLFHWVQYYKGLGGKWGRKARTGVGKWYGKDARALTYQIAKYQQRDGWSHRDVLRLAHPNLGNSKIIQYALGKKLETYENPLLDAIVELQSTPTVDKAVKLITQYGLSREMVPTELLEHPAIWDALLGHMGMEAVVRNLATMTRIGYINHLSAGAARVRQILTNSELVQNSRIHPIKVLAGLLTYQSGKGLKGKHEWKPEATLVDALDEFTFPLSFGNVTPTGRRMLLALDVSSSMGYGSIAGVTGLTPAVASATLAMITARTEKHYAIMGFAHEFKSLGITARQSLQEARRRTTVHNFGSTDCSLPMIWAQSEGVDIDAVVIYTDNETFQGKVHASVALQNYEKHVSHPVQCVVVGMTATKFTIADPKMPNMLDVVGFDTSTPEAISAFVRG